MVERGSSEHTRGSRCTLDRHREEDGAVEVEVDRRAGHVEEPGRAGRWQRSQASTGKLQQTRWIVQAVWLMRGGSALSTGGAPSG